MEWMTFSMVKSQHFLGNRPITILESKGFLRESLNVIFYKSLYGKDLKNQGFLLSMTAAGEKLVVPEILEPRSAYLANMSALWEHCPQFAQEIDQVDEMDFAAGEQTRQGGLTCRLPNENGELVYIHSRYDPDREARRWVEGVLEQAKQQSQQDKDQGWVPMCYIVDGFGLGYHVAALFEQLTGDAFIVVSEPNICLLRTALEHFDYSEMLGSDRLIFITRGDREEIFRKLEGRGTAVMMGVVFTHPVYRIEGEFHRRVHSLISEFTCYMRSSLITLLGNSVMTCKNILHNLPAYVCTPSIDMIRNRFHGCPAVVVSAGPSLRRNIGLLKSIRDRVMVIAVQTTLKPLLAAGITPDFVTSLDYHKASKRFFDGLEDLSAIHLVAEPKANWEVIDYYAPRGPMTILGNDFASIVLEGAEYPHGLLPAGTTVAHLAFYLAQFIGADPIILIGQDLAFTNNVYYSPGNALHALWKPELNRFFTIEMKEWERISRMRRTLRKTPDQDGGMIYTDEQMFTYLQQFEKDFARCSARVIDATEGGAKKASCEVMGLAEAAEKYCGTKIDPEKFAYRRQVKWLAPDLLEKALERVRHRIEDVEKLKEIVVETIDVVREMLDLVDDQPSLNRKMVRLDELRTMVKQRVETYQLVSRVSQGAELFRFRRDRTIEVENKDGKERQRQQLQRDIGYVSEINKGCDRLLELLHEAVERFELAMKELPAAAEKAKNFGNQNTWEKRLAE
jgi:hypothetical protein